MTLSPEQVRGFQDEGFLQLPGFLPRELVEDLRAACFQHFGVGEDLPRTFFKRELDVGKKVPAVKWLITHPPALEVARQLLGPSVLYTYEGAVHLGTGCRYWHKDARDTWNASGSDWAEDYRVVFFGYYLSDHLGRSGGLSLRRGSHRLKDLASGEVVTLETGPGDLVVFDCRLTHAGNTLRLRPAFGFIPRAVVMPIPPASGASRRHRLQMFAQAVLLRCPWLFRPAPRDRMAIFLAYGGDDAHTRGFFTWLRAAKGYEYLLAYDEPARL